MTTGNYTDLRALCCIIEKGSFVAAARELQVSRSALSDTIRRLERQVGVQLLNRTTRSVSPTPTGARLAARFAEAFREVEEALTEASAMSGELAGRVRAHAQRLGYEVFLRRLLPEFTQQYPRISVEVQIDDADVDIVSDGFDVAIRLGELVDQDAVAFALQPPVRQIAVASPSYSTSMECLDTRATCATIAVSAFDGPGRTHFTSGSSLRTVLGSRSRFPVRSCSTTSGRRWMQPWQARA